MKRELYINFSATDKFDEVNYELKLAVRSAIYATLERESFKYPAEVSVTFCSAEYIHSLNSKYRGVDRPTDVLSFPLFDYEGTSEEPPVDEMMNMLGDIVISLERAWEQAEEFGHSFEREVAFLTAHSMLHLLGYDHELGEEEDREMREKQNAVMDMLGLTIN